MPLQNIPSIDELAGDGALAAELDIETVAILIEDAKAAAQRATSVSRLLQGEIEARYRARIAEAFLAKGEDTGTVHLHDAGFDIEITRAKKVEWSQDDLRTIRDRIAAAGDNPAEYIETVLSVPERKYTAWPESIRATFASARTVKPGSTSVKIVRSERQEAA